MFKFGNASLKKLSTVDKRLQLLAKEVIKISTYDFAITYGLRSLEDQQKAYNTGHSKCDGIKKRSKHQDGKAIDIMCYDENGKGTWEKKYYIEVARIFLNKADELNIKIKWGGDFTTICDMPHFELA